LLPLSGLLYLDTSALAKLVLREAETEALRAALATEAPLVTSVVGAIELGRTVRRAGVPLDHAKTVVERVVLLALNEEIREHAVIVGDPVLRALDAIHLATALSIADDLDAFVCYDARLAREASRAGLVVIAPT
jgi:hypothetical protein